MATTQDREQHIFSILGLRQRRTKAGTPSITELVKAGFPLSAFDAVLSHAHVSSEQLASVVSISPRTLQRRRATPKPMLDRVESDRVARVARLYALAAEVLGSDDAARTWMLTRNRSLDNARPFALLETEGEAREVEDALGRIQHGTFA
jgi:putative toxin-antitoxin system antitoxin component (TIGR02293 family)